MRFTPFAIAASLIAATASAQPPRPYGDPYRDGPYDDRYDPYRDRADPYRDRYRDRYDPYADRYGDRYDRYARGYPDARWQELLVRPTDRRDLDVIAFRGKGGRLRLLRITPAHEVARVDIEYTNRPPQSVWIDPAAGLDAVIQVDRSARIGQIVIHSRRPHRGGYAVFGA